MYSTAVELASYVHRSFGGAEQWTVPGSKVHHTFGGAEQWTVPGLRCTTVWWRRSVAGTGK